MNISFDLETLGKTSRAPIVQIGAVKFDNSGYVLSTFSKNIIISDLDKYDLKPDYDTICWWLNQDKEAIHKVFGKNLDRITLKAALIEFKKWLGNENYNLWSHATFDPPVLVENIKAVGLEPFINFKSFKDLRTLKELAKTPLVIRKGTHHVALDDAMYQKDEIIECFRILNYK